VKDSMYPRVQFDEVVLDEEGDAVDVERLIEMFQENPEQLTDEELSYLPDDLFTNPGGTIGFGENLAEGLEDEDRIALAQDIIQWVVDDRNGRADWEERMQRGLAFLGVSTKTLGGAGDPEEGFSRVVHPGVQEARVQFQARAMAEVWPAGGPVNTQVIGAATPETNAQAQRLRGYLNYAYMHEMPEAFHEEEKSLYALPIYGSTFKKVTYDPIRGRPCVRYINPARFYVPGDATDLESAPRYTETFEETGNDTLRKMRAGIYRRVSLDEPDAPSIDRSALEEALDDISGHHRVGYNGDQNYLRYECYVYLVLPGDEDIDPETGEPSGLAKPYIVTVDDGNQEILSIYRGWRDGDPNYIRRVFHNHYRFLPGDGFYGHGLFHAIGGLAETATGALRALLDAAVTHNLQGGLIAQDLDIKGGSEGFRRKPGQWVRVRAAAEDMARGLITIPTHEPSSVLFQLLSFVTDGIQRFASTTDVMIGDAANSAPVGTTLAQIEQGSRVYSGIHKRLHHAHAAEYKMVAELIAENIPEEGYPYALPEGVENTVMAEDFDARVDVIPVSDPNIVSQGQRIARADSTLRLASQYPDLHDMRAVLTQVHLALGNADIDTLMPPPQEAPVLDPVSEVGALLKGEPVQAGPEQDHQAHANFLDQWFNTLRPEHQEQLRPAYQALLFSHMALALKQQMEAQAGMPAEEIPPEMLSQFTLSPVLRDGEADMTAREQDRADAESQHKMALESAQVAHDIQLQDSEAAFEGDLALMSATSEEQRRDMMAQSKMLSEASHANLEP